MATLFRLVAALLLALGLPLPASASVVITFWSHELGNSFPHTFFTLRGVPDAGGPPVDRNFGFTAKTVSPALLFGTVPGRLDLAKPSYIEGSDAQFSIVLTDAQYQAELALAAAWDDATGDGHYNLNDRNCVHFVKEAARIAGLADLDHPKLMKKPRSYLQAVAAANPGRVTVIDRPGRDYLASLPPLAPPPAVSPPLPDAAAAAPVDVLPPDAPVPAPIH